MKNLSSRLSRLSLLILTGVLLSGCQSGTFGPQFSSTLEGSEDITLPSTRNQNVILVQEGSDLSRNIKAQQQFAADQRSLLQQPPASQIYPGTGRFVRNVKSQKQPAGQPAAKGDITLNFENTDLREVVKVILGDTLKLNYILDPGVRGGVTMQTGAPIAREDLIPTLETLLRMNNATMVDTGGQYRVVPVTKAPRGLTTPQLADAAMPLPQGYSVRIHPLRNIAAEEMNEILKPLVLQNSVIRVDKKRNLLVLAGTQRELFHMLDVINTFDVNWIKGMSVGFFSLHNSKVEDVQKDLDAILGGEGGAALGGLVRITPINSANGFLVVTPRPNYLKQVAEWISRLDTMAESGSEEQMYVYRVRNGKSENLANLLSQLFESKGSSTTKSKQASVAPGLTAKETSSGKRISNNQKSVAKKQAKAAAKTSGAKSVTAATSGSLDSDIRIVADEDHNTLLIMATPPDYRKILAVLEELDVVPLQVNIEVTIVEVLLKDSLKYGLSWFFKGAGIGSYDTVGGLGGSNNSTDISGGIGSLVNGFNWSLLDSTGAVRAVLTAFADDSLVNVLSAPSVMVLDNHEASIQVGDEVPTISQSQTGTGGGVVGNVIQNIQYRDTGIILHVKPRVNPGGLVTMEVSQEVSTPVTTEIEEINSPTIQTRKIESTVAVQSGQTVVLGGLIRDKRAGAKGGVPGLYKIPVIGALFGESANESERVELVIVITPRVVANAQDAEDLKDDFRIRMQGLKDEFLREAGVIPREENEAQAPVQQPEFTTKSLIDM
jgi:general secretion pathway protein D